MRVLIINLTRFGDLLQTQPVIHALRERGHEAGLLCLDNFAEAARLLDGLETLVPLPGSRLLAGLDRDWRLCLGELGSFVETIRTAFRPDEVLNLTSSTGARLLARLLAQTLRKKGEALPLRGFSVDNQGFGHNDTLWGSFFEASTRKRGCSPYNLVDVFLKASATDLGSGRFALKRPEPARLQAMRQRLEEAAQGLRGGYLALQLGASEDRRRWPETSFAWLGRHAAEDFGLMPLLLGSAAEKKLAQAYLATGAPGVDLTGKTSLPDLAAILCLCRLLVTNDTGTMHLAAALGLPSLAIFLATAQACDTGPYLEGCCCVEPALSCHPCAFGSACPHELACRQTITPEALWPLLAARLSSGAWPDQAPEPTARTARVWLSERDASGFMDLRSLSGHDGEERWIWLRLQRHFYRQLLDRADAFLQSGAPGEKKLTEAFALPESHTGKNLPKEKKEELSLSLTQVENLFELLRRQGASLLKRPTTSAGRRFLDTVQRISQLLESAETSGGAFDALGRLWTVASQNQADLVAVTRMAGLFQAMLHSWRQALEQETGWQERPEQIGTPLA